MRILIGGIAVALLCAPVAAIEIDPDWSIARTWNEQNLFCIRRSTPRPPVHARNLYHVNAAMYDAWTAYSPTGRGVFFTEKHVAGNPDGARHVAISHAAYRILKARYVAGNGPNIAQIQADLDATFVALGYDPAFTSTVGDSPAAIGNRIAATILAAGLLDGSNEQNNYAPNNGYAPVNDPMPFKIPGTVMDDPNRWQPLAFDFLVLQNGEIIGQAVQVVVCPHWNNAQPFGMNDYERNPLNNLYHDQGPPPLIGTQEMRDQAVSMLEHSAILDTAQGVMVDVSPTAWANSPLGSYEQPGYGLNPVTGEAYASNVVNFADYARVNAEFWADGADSETPPGHWHVVANMVADDPEFEHKLYGDGPSLNRLEWDVKMYLAVGGAVHDAAITSWGMKGVYDSSRPISFVRYMGQSGQSSDPKLPNYSPNGLPLIPGLVEIVQPEDVLPGGEFEDLAQLVYIPEIGEPIGVDDHVGDIVVKSWLGGFSAGTTTGIQVTGPIPGHIYRTDSGWHIGDWDLGIDDTPGTLNPDFAPKSVVISEARNAQRGADTDEYVELSGPPGASLDGLSFIVIGDEVQTGVPSPQGRVQVEIDLTGYSINANGTFLIGRSTLSLAKADIVNVLSLKEIGNTTYALAQDFTGYPGQELDFFENGQLTATPWTSIMDSVGLRRNTNPQGIYFGAPTLGPVNSQTQTYGVGWQLATYWMTYQASNFVNPPFPGYTSGHSTFSRSAAEVLTGLTGSPYFPGGFQTYTIPAGWLKFENGPEQDLVFNWVRYADLADQAGESRIWGGIHPPVDDLPARVSGYAVGHRAFQRIQALFNGYAVTTDITGDGVVDGQDLLALVGSWGPCLSPPCAGDFNGDGVVNIFDLLHLLNEWG
ncbi:MAG: hypothetical protein L0219_07710 [Phycisphaerales bacterium]|nr:hypothetical protein [Phycisphaerales bacterium]MCI0675106.1 hypothetical protein [Phycisphaerales bacterium]